MNLAETISVIAVVLTGFGLIGSVVLLIFKFGSYKRGIDDYIRQGRIEHTHMDSKLTTLTADVKSLRSELFNTRTRTEVLTERIDNHIRKHHNGNSSRNPS